MGYLFLHIHLTDLLCDQTLRNREGQPKETSIQHGDELLKDAFKLSVLIDLKLPLVAKFKDAINKSKGAPNTKLLS